MSIALARIWHLPRLLRILWAGTRRVSPVARRRDEDAFALGKLILRGKVWAFKQKGRISAFLARDGVRLHALYACPRARGQGGGTALLQHAQDATQRLELYTAADNMAARRFYLRHGFRELRRGQGLGNDEGLPDIHMVWDRPQQERHVP